MNFGTVVRLIAIALGIVSVTILAWKGFGFRFDPFFVSVLGLLEDWSSDLVRPLELLLIEPSIEWLRSFGWNLTLHPHWKHTFVLLWLYFSAFARRDWNSGAHTKYVVEVSYGGLIAVVTGALTGLVAPAVEIVAVWPLVAFVMFWSSFGSDYQVRSPLDVLERIGWPLFASPVIVWAGIGAVQIIPYPEMMPNPGLVLLAALICIIAVVHLLIGIGDFDEIKDEHGFRTGMVHRTYLLRPNTQLGLDILAVLFGAAAIVTINQMLVRP